MGGRLSSPEDPSAHIGPSAASPGPAEPRLVEEHFHRIIPMFLFLLHTDTSPYPELQQRNYRGEVLPMAVRRRNQPRKMRKR